MPAERGCEVIYPGFPAGVAEIAVAVTAAEEVHLKYAPASSGHGTSQQGGGPSCIIHFVREGVDVKYTASAARGACRSMIEGE